MRKTLFALFIVLLVFGATSAFERQEATLPIISDPLSQLDAVVGWMITPGGGWISRENRIPKYMSSDYDNLQDYERYSLGVDNFQLLELREVTIEGNLYGLLLMHKMGGSYTYPTIREDWFYNYQVRGYVFETSDMQRLIFNDKEPMLLELEVLANPRLTYYNNRYQNDYVQDLAVKINEEMAKDIGPQYLVINMMRVGDSVRFITLDKHLFISEGYELVTYSGLYVSSPEVPLKMEDVTTEEVFRNFYFETDLQTFMDFWNR